MLALCKSADEQMVSELALVHNKKRTEKGIAFPCCVSVNEVAGHNSPLEAAQTIQDGDLVKVDLGVHIDGFVGMAAHSVQVGTPSAKASDLLLAGYTALQAAVRLLKPGQNNNEVTEAISKVCAAYNVNAVEGVLSHEVKKHLIDGNRVIINKETFELKVDDFEFAQNEVYVLDIMVSSGEGKMKDSSERTTVYKRALERMYNLRGKSARAFFTEMIEKYPSMCFSLNGFEDQIVTFPNIRVDCQDGSEGVSGTRPVGALPHCDREGRRDGRPLQGHRHDRRSLHRRPLRTPPRRRRQERQEGRGQEHGRTIGPQYG